MPRNTLDILTLEVDKESVEGLGKGWGKVAHKFFISSLYYLITYQTLALNLEYHAISRTSASHGCFLSPGINIASIVRSPDASVEP